MVNILFDTTNKTFTSPTKYPIALDVCFESRQEAKRFYKLSFGIRAGNAYPRDKLPKIWFDAAVDILFINPFIDISGNIAGNFPFHYWLLNATDLDTVKSIAVEENFLSFVNYREPLSHSNFARMTSIINTYSLETQPYRPSNSGKFKELDTKGDEGQAARENLCLEELRESTGLGWKWAMFKPCPGDNDGSTCVRETSRLCFLTFHSLDS